MTLPERVVALHRALARSRLPHAFGGAIALAYWTQDPRGTSDVDVNVFIPAENGDRALRKLPDGVTRPPEAMLAAGTLDVHAVRSTLRTLLEPGDHRFARLDQAVRAAGSS